MYEYWFSRSSEDLASTVNFRTLVESPFPLILFQDRLTFGRCTVKCPNESGSFRPLSHSPLSRFAHFPFRPELFHPQGVSPTFLFTPESFRPLSRLPPESFRPLIVFLFRPQKWNKASIFLLTGHFSS